MLTEIGLTPTTNVSKISAIRRWQALYLSSAGKLQSGADTRARNPNRKFQHMRLQRPA